MKRFKENPRWLSRGVYRPNDVLGLQAGQRLTTGVTVNVRLNRKMENHDAEANKLAKILLEKYPDAATKDSISITTAEGYDLGIAP
jgi:hypothetical protein